MESHLLGYQRQWEEVMELNIGWWKGNQRGRRRTEWQNLTEPSPPLTHKKRLNRLVYLLEKIFCLLSGSRLQQWCLEESDSRDCQLFLNSTRSQGESGIFTIYGEMKLNLKERGSQRWRLKRPQCRLKPGKEGLVARYQNKVPGSNEVWN